MDEKLATERVSYIVLTLALLERTLDTKLRQTEDTKHRSQIKHFRQEVTRIKRKHLCQTRVTTLNPACQNSTDKVVVTPDAV